MTARAELKTNPDRRAQLWLGDGLVVLPLLDPAHLIVTDPPYAFDKMGGDWRASDHVRTTKGQTVGNLTAGMAFKADQPAKAATYFRPFAAALFDVLIEGGFLALFAAPRLQHGFAIALESAGFAIRDQLVWLHGEGHFKAASLVRFGVGRENRVPQARPQFESIILAQKLPRGPLAECWQRLQTGLMRERSLCGSVPANVLQFAKPDKQERIAGGGHPTQKPVALLRELVHRYSLPGQTVLDPFAGSGSTLVAARALDRLAVGIEADPAFALVAADRMGIDTTTPETPK